MIQVLIVANPPPQLIEPLVAGAVAALELRDLPRRSDRLVHLLEAVMAG